MRWLGLFVVVLSACGSSEDSTSDGSVPLTSGTYAGTYSVPTVTDELAAAALFDVAEVHWTVVGSTVTLDYDLPEGLVGGKVGVTLGGPATSGDTALTLTGENGVGTCTATATVITCSEDLQNLGALPVDPAVIEARATLDGHSVTDRRAVANLFGSDPIGIVTFDLTRSVVDDHGGGGGGGGND